MFASRMRLPMALLIGVGAVLAFPVSAAAMQPGVDHFHATYSAAFGCDGFVDNYAGSTTAVITTFYNPQGDEIRRVFRFTQLETDTNSVTGTTITVRTHFITDESLVTGVEASHGEIFMANRRGLGTVIHETGTIVVDGDGNIIKEAGVHEVTDTESQIFCTALS
jgi:hypothetical protein